MMPDDIERKRLKKKMLDRWENEGGRIAADPVIANQSSLASQREGEGTQAPASNNSSRVDSISSRKEGAGLLRDETRFLQVDF
jgi:hypothetical protein